MIDGDALRSLGAKAQRLQQVSIKITAAARESSGQRMIILPKDRSRLGCVTQIRVRATCQRDEFSLCTSKFESDMPSHAVGLGDVQKRGG